MKNTNRFRLEHESIDYKFLTFYTVSSGFDFTWFGRMYFTRRAAKHICSITISKYYQGEKQCKKNRLLIALGTNHCLIFCSWINWKNIVKSKPLLVLSMTPLKNCHLKFNVDFFYINELVGLHFKCNIVADTLPKNFFLLVQIRVVLVIKITNIIIVMQFFLWKFAGINYFSCNSL